jgi:iron complex outermembrane receptor protein
MRTLSVWGTALAGLIAALSTHEAVAQGQSPTPAGAESDGARAGDLEIVVTARKREEALGEVPLSSTVMTDDIIESLVLDGVEDFIRNTPGAVVAVGGPEYTNDIVIRGQGAGRLGNSEAATGLYRNGLYVAGGEFGGRSFSRMDLFDLERFEAFRGPQGGAFGRNAVGGAVNLVTRKPSYEVEGFVSGSRDSVERTDLSGAIGGPLGDGRVRARVAGFYDEQAGGHVRNAFDGRTLDRRRYHGVRSTIQAEPTEALQLQVIAERYRAQAPSFAAVTFHPNRGEQMFVRNFNGPSNAVINEDNLFFEAALDLGAVRAAYNVFYRDRNSRRVDDLDWYNGGRPVTDLWIADRFSNFEKTTHDLRLESTTQANLIWLVGADLTRTKEDVTGITSGFSTGNRNQSVSTDGSHSLYALAEYKFSDRITVAVDGRGTWDDKRATVVQIGIGSANLNRVQLNFQGRTDDFNFTPSASVTYSVAPGTNVYARVAQAYRAGGFNSTIPTGAPLAYGAEYTTGVEAGVKSRLFQGALQIEAAAFQMRSDDVQVVTRGPTNAGITTFLQNGGDARISGLEATLNHIWQFSPGRRLVSNVGTTLMEGEYTSGSVRDTLGGATLVVVPITGNAFPRVRDVTLVARSTYFQTLPGGGELFALVNAQSGQGGWEDSINRDRLSDFTLWDARIGLKYSGVTVSLYGKNLTDEIFPTERLDAQWFFNDPRIYGAEVRYRF